MNLQQVLQPKSSANGYGRRRVEREISSKWENKLQYGKSNPSKSTSSGLLTSNQSLGCESPSRDRLVYITSCLIGHHVEVQVKNGSIYSGIFHAANADKDFGIILKMARMIKDGSLRGQKSINEIVTKAPSKTLIIPENELVQVIAKGVSVITDALSNELLREKQQEILIDSFISQSRNADLERELEPWIPDEDNPQCPELENIFDSPWNRRWDQFEINETLFGVKSTFNEEFYTTKLERGPQTRELEKEAVRIAREIEGEETQDLHLAEERGRHLHENFDLDEETRFSSVYRGSGADDAGYDEHENLIVDSHNSETFGGSSSDFNSHSTELTDQNGEERLGVALCSSSLEAESSQSSTAPDLHRSSSNDHARQLASELPVRSFPSSDGATRIQENFYAEHEVNDEPKGFAEMQIQAEDVQMSKSETYAPSSVASKIHGRTSSLAGLSEGSLPSSSNSRGQHTSSTTSPASDFVGPPSTSRGSRLSPSSSVGSLSSEKSTLNPHAKEFKLNPNAMSFIPSQTPLRPPSPVPDGSLYFPTNAPPMHAMPVGIGIGQSFAGHQPVIFNPQAPPLPQTYFHPNAPQYGQQMFLNHPRQVVYMPGYPPEMQYKGRDF